MSAHRHEAPAIVAPMGRTALTMGAALRLAIALAALVPLWAAVWWSLS
ncbi:MAG: hypothetical protein O3B22_03910 [Proteobacteria bacterium]|nr:hypothetical protein [Pseudomonadota bacterium]MDA1071358.1 hypothetical protein [Pseudomonadota bacterium]